MEKQVNSADVQTILNEELEDLRLRIIANHEAVGQVASGRTRESLKVEVNDKEGILWGRFPFGALETGRKPGKTPRNFSSIIRQWIIDKGIPVTPIPYVRQPSERWQPKYTPQERGLMSLSEAIAYKIKTEGTSLYRSGGRKDIYTPEIDKTINNISDRIGSIFSLKVESINENL